MKNIVLLFALTLIFLGVSKYSFAQTDTIPEWKKNEVQKEINKLNELIRQKGYKWKAGVTSRSYLSDEQLKEFIGLPKYYMNKALPDTAQQENINNTSSGKGVL